MELEVAAELCADRGRGSKVSSLRGAKEMSDDAIPLEMTGHCERSEAIPLGNRKYVLRLHSYKPKEYDALYRRNQ